jgi:hypothetical protein
MPPWLPKQVKSMYDELNKRTLGAVITDLKRAISNRKVEMTPHGLMVLGDTDISIGGVFDTSISRHELVQRAIDDGDPEKEAWMRKWVAAMGFSRTREGYFTDHHSADHNLIPQAGMKYLLDVIFGSRSKFSTWYIGLFTSNHDPAEDWDCHWAGALSGPEATELADAAYDESGRQAAVFGSAANGTASGTGTIATSAATAFTLATGQSAVSIYGATLNSIATVTYNVLPANTTEELIAATKFGSAKTGLGAADVINVSYSITGSSPSS